MASTPDVGAGWPHEPASVSRSLQKAKRLRVAARIPVPKPSWAMVVASALIAGVCAWWLTDRAADLRAAVDAEVAAKMLLAQQALIDRRYVDPAGMSAVDYYEEVLALDPRNAQAKAGIARALDRVMSDVGHLIPRGKLADAAVAIENVRRIRPDHPQLARAESLLRQEQERLVMLAKQEMAPPRNPVVTDRKREVRPEARSIAAARERLKNGQLLAPRDDSAAFHALAARKGAPDSEQTQALLRDVQAQLMAAGERAAQAGNIEVANQALAAARELGASNASLQPLQSRLQSQQQAERKEQLLQLVLQRTQENHLMDPLRDSATEYLQQLGRLDRRSPAYQRALDALGTRLVANARTAIYQQNYEHAARLLAHARSLGFNNPDLEKADSTVRTALQQPRQPVTAAQLRRRIKHVEPEFPDAAKRTHSQGWVDVELTVAPNGAVRSARVTNASAANVFDKAALAAVRKWRYEPRPSSGRNDVDVIPVRVQFQH